MKLFLAPQSSLELIRYLRSINGEEGLMGTPLRRRLVRNAINSQRALDELDETAQRWLGHLESPVHAYVADHAQGTSTKRLVTHVHSAHLPYGALLDMGHDLYMCAPHFTFMQMATQLDLIDTISLGMELCGFYSHWSLGPAELGMASKRESPETKGYTFQLPRSTWRKRIKAFVERQRGERGIANARNALRWVLDSSASPMETAVYLLLCLPKRLGGYALNQPVLNPKLIISNPGGPKVRYPDLFWLGSNIDVEYNSDASHSGEWSRYRDSRREVELTVANVRVLPLTRAQLMSTDGFDDFAQGLRKMLGIRARRPDAIWTYRRDELRHRLLARWE